VRIERNRVERIAPGGGEFSPLELSGVSPAEAIDYGREVWDLAELLCFHDREFIQHAYLVLLKRDCDEKGMSSRLHKLRTGEMSRVETLFRLRYGPEGKQQGTRVRGLERAFLVEKLCGIPVLGILPRYVRALVRLPRLQRDIEEIRGLIAMQKNDSEDSDEVIVDFQNTELQKLYRRLGR
jgi:hypothetical protein